MYISATATSQRWFYNSNTPLRHSIRGNGRSVWGIAMLNNRIYVVTYCSANIDVYGMATYDSLGSIAVDGLKDPWDLVACPHQQCLFLCDWHGKCVYCIRPGSENQEVTRTKWLTMDCRPRGLSVANNGSNLLIVCADWKKETGADSLRMYDASAQKRPKMLRKVRLPEVDSVWQAVHNARTDEFLVCHGGRYDRLHRVCRIDKDGNVLASYGGNVGSGRQQLTIPTSIFVDSQEQVRI